MRQVKVIYHYEDGSWWADSPDPALVTFVAGGRDLEETRRLAHEGAEFHLGERVRITELFDPRHVVTYLHIDPFAPSVTVSGGPAPARPARFKTTVTPAQPCPVAS